jgi:hypothetical protein
MPFILNPLTGKFDYYQSSTGSQGMQGIQGMPGQDGEDGEPGQSIVGPPGPAGTPATPGAAAYGEMIVTNNATGLACTLQNTWYQVVSGWALDDANGFTYASGALTCKTAGAYLMTANMTMSSTSSNQVYLFGMFRNGSLIAGHVTSDKFVNATDINSVSLTGVLDGVQVGDVFTLWVQNTTAAGQTATISYANFSLSAIQGATGAPGITSTAFIYMEADPPDEPMMIPGPQGANGAPGAGGGNFPLSKQSTDIGETMTITAGFMYHALRNFTNNGSIVNLGDMGVL